MIFDEKAVLAETFYPVMIQSLIPRPIAWVLSKNPNGSFNVAPFSFFNGVTSEPPIIMISVGWKDDVTRKDTWTNIEERNTFVVHIPPAQQAEAVVASSAALPLDESEIDFAKLKTVSQDGFPLPRIEGPKIAMLCEKHKILEIGQEKQGLILGEIKKLWVDDAIVRQDGGKIRLDPKQINPLARLGGKDYSSLGPVFSVNRPK